MRGRKHNVALKQMEDWSKWDQREWPRPPVFQRVPRQVSLGVLIM